MGLASAPYGANSSRFEYDHIFTHTVDMAPTERVTVTLSGELLDEIDRLERNRSRFIAEAVEHELARRRREALLQSVRSPHAETVDLVDTGLADWTADLPDDEGLVDPAGGTAVRWIEGQGWVRESV
jgi:post-segregation antitoxin (ccd killing protein)